MCLPALTAGRCEERTKVKGEGSSERTRSKSRHLFDIHSEEHEEEAEKIANGDAWEHGFWAGTLTFLRLIQGLATREDYVDEDGESITAETVRANAAEEYPNLDS